MCVLVCVCVCVRAIVWAGGGIWGWKRVRGRWLFMSAVYIVYYILVARCRRVLIVRPQNSARAKTIGYTISATFIYLGSRSGYDYDGPFSQVYIFVNRKLYYIFRRARNVRK